MKQKGLIVTLMTAFFIAIFVIITMYNKQQNIKNTLAQVPQQFQEVAELNDLMQRVSLIIAVPDNCPPDETIERIEQLYHKYHDTNEHLKSVYTNLKVQLNNMECH